MQVDWLIKNVTVIDGSGGPEFRGDVAITGDRIVDIAPALNVTAQQVIDGEGRVLAPGFIDVHTHDDINVIRIPEYTLQDIHGSIRSIASSAATTRRHSSSSTGLRRSYSSSGGG